MEYDIFYPERVFGDSFTFNKWVPLMCADISNLWSFRQIYNCDPDSSVCIGHARRMKRRTKYSLPQASTPLHPPFFFRNHPVNYVTLTGRLVDVTEIVLHDHRFSIGTNLAVTLTVDDSSGDVAKCIIYTQQGVYNLRKMKNAIYEVQGYLTEHVMYGRQVRVIQIAKKNGLEDELQSWKEVMKIRHDVLTRHWDHLEMLALREAEDQKELEHGCQVDMEEEEGLDLVSELNGESNGVDSAPKVYCSFHRENSLLVQDPKSLVETRDGGVRLAASYRKTCLVSQNKVVLGYHSSRNSISFRRSESLKGIREALMPQQSCESGSALQQQTPALETASQARPLSTVEHQEPPCSPKKSPVKRQLVSPRKAHRYNNNIQLHIGHKNAKLKRTRSHHDTPPANVNRQNTRVDLKVTPIPLLEQQGHVINANKVFISSQIYIDKEPPVGWLGNQEAAALRGLLDPRLQRKLRVHK